MVERNIHALLERRRQDEQGRSMQDRMADRRADLDLQISLLSEHEVTRLIALTSAIAERMGLPTERDPALEELKRDVRPEVVLETMERHARAAAGGQDVAP